LAVERLPENSPERGHFEHVRQLMDRAIAEGRNTVRGLRSITEDSLDLEQAFSRMEREFDDERRIQFRVTAVGKPRSLHPIIRDEVYRIGREALAMAGSRLRMTIIEAEVKYYARRLRITNCASGDSVDPGERDVDLSMIRERAERIGAQLKVWSRDAMEMKIELSVPGRVAFLNDFSKQPFGLLPFSLLPSKRMAWSRRRRAGAAENEKGREQ
jgi:signal transduction histidine kinase